MLPLNVFLVEDNETIRQTLVAALEECAAVRVTGFAETANEAIDLLVRNPPACDLAIIDVMLLQGSGVEVLKALQRADSPLKRVMLTNYATPLVRDHCLALGADRVFDKSVEIDGLLDYCGALATVLR